MDFVLSSNPPNPKTSFRLGDWICSSPKCAAHNFGRNLSCIGCGCQRSPSSPPRPAISSPRFTVPNPSPPPSDSHLPKPVPHHPLLTPSGRAFAVGGTVQNISSDHLNPCIMFWPDNEALPDQGQIRPSALVGISQPPILNTGNRGPISHQPGDWVCQKCNYLNWRRRKVCQTCLPYAEGNGDSISAAVQAERIALLTNVLSRTRLDPSPQRSNSHTPPAERSALASAPALLHFHRPQSPAKSVQRSRSHVTLPRHLAPSPIYQTPLPSSGPPRFGPELTPFQHRIPSPIPLLYSTGPPSSPFLGAGLAPAYRMRVLSSPAPPLQRDWNPHPSLDIPRQPVKVDDAGSGSELPTPAITSPLLPAFLRDVVKNGTSDETQSPKAELLPIVTFPLTAPAPATNPVPKIVSRPRNDSGSSTCSTSSSSSSLISLTSSNVSTSGLSMSLSATSISSCGGFGIPPRSSSSSPTITTTVSSCPTPPAEKGLVAPAVLTATCAPSSLPFMSFGNAGIWKMDGEESRSLKGFNVPLPAPHHGLGVGANVVGGQRGHHRHDIAPVAIASRR